MRTLEKEVIRLELQVGQLISIVANQNDRLNKLEGIAEKKRGTTIQKIPLAEHV